MGYSKLKTIITNLIIFIPNKLSMRHDLEDELRKHLFGQRTGQYARIRVRRRWGDLKPDIIRKSETSATFLDAHRQQHHGVKSGRTLSGETVICIRDCFQILDKFRSSLIKIVEKLLISFLFFENKKD